MNKNIFLKNTITFVFLFLLVFVFSGKKLEAKKPALRTIKKEQSQRKIPTAFDMIFAAIERGDKATLEKLLLQNIDINATRSHGYANRTPLHVAAFFSQAEIAKFLISKGANVNAKNEKGNTPLHIAASISLDVSKILIENGADVNAQNIYGITPLHFSAKKKEADVTLFLLSHNVEVNIQHDKSTPPPLHWAAKNNSWQNVKVLIEHGADVNIQDDMQTRPLHYMAEHGQDEMVLLLLQKGADANAQDIRGYTALHNAVFYNRRNTVQVLAENGADTSIKEYFGATPLELSKDANISSYLRSKQNGRK